MLNSKSRSLNREPTGAIDTLDGNEWHALFAHATPNDGCCLRDRATVAALEAARALNFRIFLADDLRQGLGLDQFPPVRFWAGPNLTAHRVLEQRQLVEKQVIKPRHRPTPLDHQVRSPVTDSSPVQPNARSKPRTMLPTQLIAAPFPGLTVRHGAHGAVATSRRCRSVQGPCVGRCSFDRRSADSVNGARRFRGAAKHRFILLGRWDTLGPYLAYRSISQDSVNCPSHKHNLREFRENLAS